MTMSVTQETPATSLTQTPMPGTAPVRPENPAKLSVDLFAISVVGLFLELLLIRWVTTEIRIFAYLQNTVLVVCFLGLGMGCWDSRKKFSLRDLLVPLVIFAGLLALPPSRNYLGNSITDLLSGASGHEIWDPTQMSGLQRVIGGAIGLALTFGMMFLLWATFVPVGRMLGSSLNKHPNTLWAYSVNVAGSLVGIWLFVGCSALGLPPVAWFIVFVAGAMFFLGQGGKSKLVDLGLLAVILGFGALAGYEPGWGETRWSPYQKLSIYDTSRPKEATTIWGKIGGERRPATVANFGTHMIGVNNVGYQATVDHRPGAIPTNDPEKYPPDQLGYSQYDVPPKLHPNPRKTLVVGAGSGNDVAGMLRNGAQSVIAVEIDPEIIAFGRQLHPEKPYDDPRVTVVNDDARSYFATTTEKFDVIAFGLLDSHTTTAMTNARLDHYVYTLESLRAAKSLLNPGGIIVLSFEAQKPFMLTRMSGALESVFGREPLVFRVPQNGYGWGGVIFVAGDQDASRVQIAADPKLDKLVKQWQADLPEKLSESPELATDDWPYIYLEGRRIPMLYLLLAGSLLALFAVGVRSLKLPQIVRGWDKTQTHFFLLGAAFMLLEVQNISKAAVVLGNTWNVNAVIISGILLMILAANALSAVAQRVPTWPFYFALIGSCLGLYYLDLATFGFLPYRQKAAVVGLLTSLPMLFSGVIFIRSFANVQRKDAALGANLFGSLAGALIQSVTFVTGIKALLLIVAGFYLGAILLKPRSVAKSAMV